MRLSLSGWVWLIRYETYPSRTDTSTFHFKTRRPRGGEGRAGISPDELALIRPSDRHVVPLTRPISLKNDSIGLMREARLARWSKAAGLMEIARNAMNDNLHGAAGFDLLADIFQTSGRCRFTYGQLDDAVAAFADKGET